MKKTILSFAAALTLLFTSCVKDAGTGTSTVAFQLKAAVSAVNGAAITWTAGTAGVANTKIEAKKSDNTDVEFKSAPNAQVDLFGAVNISNVAIPTGTFRKVEFWLELDALNSKPVLFLDGTYTAGGVTTPISFEAGNSLTIKSSVDSIVISSANANYTSLTTLGLVTLTQDVTEADLKAASRTNGKIVISSASNAPVYTKMMANLAKTQVCSFK